MLERSRTGLCSESLVFIRFLIFTAIGAVSKLAPRSISSPAGTNSIAGGSAPGKDRNRGPTLQGLPLNGVMRPLQGWSEGPRYRGRCPRLLNLSPSGTSPRMRLHLEGVSSD